MMKKVLSVFLASVILLSSLSVLAGCGTDQADDAPEYISEDTEDENELQIVKTKRFGIKPMDPEEACLQMELLGHSFYVFCNAETDEVNVVYKRKDGKFGLIEPTFE